MVAKRFPTGVVAFDTETTGLSPYDGSRIFLVGMEDEEGTVVMGERGTRAWRQAREVVEDPGVDLVSHNAKFDMKMVMHEGWTPAGKWHDTMMMAHIVNEYEKKLNLKYLSKTYLAEEYEEADMIASWIKKNKRSYVKNRGREPNYRDFYLTYPDMFLSYLEKDLDCCMRLFWSYMPLMRESFQNVYDCERELIPHVVKLEDTGVHVDTAYVVDQIGALNAQQKKLHDKLERIGGRPFNHRSHPQLKQMLDELGYAVDNTRRETLESLELIRAVDNGFIKALLKLRGLDKINGTYLKPFTQLMYGDIIHPSFWQCGEDEGVKTARFSCSNPNFQNIPVRESDIVRRAITPRPGFVLVSIDYRQIEPRLLAHYANDDEMIDSFIRHDRTRDPMDDCYIDIARRIWPHFKRKKLMSHRFQSKTILLGNIYGIGVAKMVVKLGMDPDTDYNKVRTLKNEFLRAIPAIRRLNTDCTRDLHQQGYVKDIFGRCYRVPLQLSYKGINALIQGTAAGVMKRGIIRVGNTMHEDINATSTRVLVANNIHDELVFEVRRPYLRLVVPKLVRAMEDQDTFKVPMRVDVKWSPDNWGELRPYE